MKKRMQFTILYGIVILAGLFRFFAMNWDSGYHMHPDERAIILTVIDFPKPPILGDFFSTESPWNPKFFAYGSFPFYLLYWVAQLIGLIDPIYTQYDSINIVGRYISAVFDLGTLVFLFLIARRLLSPAFALLTALFYALSVLPIQLSHFYAVDTLLTFFITGILYCLLLFYEKQTFRHALFLGLFLGFAVATKISAIVVLVPMGVTLLLLFLNHIHKNHPIKSLLKKLLPQLLTISLSAFMIFLFVMPYALIDFKTFLQHTIEQSAMTKNAFTFPYTLQYVGKIPYLYELKNIFFYGLGPVIGFFSISGIVLLTLHVIWKVKKEPRMEELILLSFFWVYFLIVGNFSIGFMRYMLPLYPLLCLAGAYLLFQAVTLFPIFKSKGILIIGGLILFLSLLIWPVSFSQIYAQNNTRIQASAWIFTHIMPGESIAIEHWDDALPVIGQERFDMITLPLYDADTPQKWEGVRQQLGEADYIILASNRLYTPLMKLTDCTNLPPGRCYRETAAYYQSLFDGTLGFTKVAEFTSYPRLPLTNIEFPDQDADESFTVYDHPKIMIFKKNN